MSAPLGACCSREAAAVEEDPPVADCRNGSPQRANAHARARRQLVRADGWPCPDDGSCIVENGGSGDGGSDGDGIRGGIGRFQTLPVEVRLVGGTAAWWRNTDCFDYAR